MTAAMTCAQAREALSADLDGEPGPDGLAGHLDACPACRAWQDRLHELTRAVRLDLPSPPAELAARVTAALQEAAVMEMSSAPGPELEPLVCTAGAEPAPPTGTAGARYPARAGLGLVGGLQVLLAVRELLPGAADTSGVHLEHEVSSFAVAIGVAMLLAAVTPRRAREMLPVVAVAAGLLGLTALDDVVSGRVPPAHEYRHLLAVTGLALLVRLSRRAGSAGRPRPGRRWRPSGPGARAAGRTGLPVIRLRRRRSPRRT
ncbi:MAG TPA: hypothetical protein VFP72_09890, partial [Kineosporiaceae bacterium]|nr:hypothetical protein [Kineosporiaceae bacterium]